MKRWIVAASLVAACGTGEVGPAGSQGERGGAAEACTARSTEAGWTVECPDGSSVTLPPGGCEEIAGEDGKRTIRCADGSEGVVIDGETLEGSTTVVGRVAFAGGGPAAGALVEIVDADFRTEADADGSFRIDGIPAGHWTLQASLGDAAQVVIPDQLLLPGTWDAGTIELALGGAVPVGADLNESATGYFVEVEIVELPSGKAHAVEGRLRDIRWIDDDTVELTREGDEGLEYGAWRRAVGQIVWREGLEFASVGPAGTLAVRRDDEGQQRLVLFRADGDAIDLGAGAASLVRLGERTAWLVEIDGGLQLVDGDAAEPALVPLDDRVPGPGQLRIDDTGLLAWADYADEGVLYDLAAATQLGVDAIPSLGAGLATWSEGGAHHRYDARTGYHGVLEGATVFTQEAENPWIAFRLGGAWYAEERGASNRVELGSDSPLHFSPSGRRLLLQAGDGSHRVLDLETGEGTALEEATAIDGWVGDDALLIETAEGRAIAWSDGRVLQIDVEPELLTAEEGFVILQRGGAGIVWDVAAAERIEVGPLEAAWVVPGGERLVWRTPLGRLRVLDPATGTVHQIADRVANFDVFATAAVYETLGGGTMWAAYP